MSDFNLNISLVLNSNTCKKIHEYVHTGYDIEKWKYVLKNHKDELKKVDEIVVCNDSFFGPVFGIKNILAKMQNENFWGITDHRGFWKNGRYIGAFLQRYFMGFSSTLIGCERFDEYWNSIGVIESYEASEDRFEFVFSGFMENLGYKYATYIDLSDLLPQEKKYALSHYIHESATLLQDYKLPFVAIASFTVEKDLMLVYGNGNNASDTYNYIKQRTSYPIANIDEVLLDNNNIYDLWSSLNLHKVIAPQRSDRGLRYELKRAAIIAYLYYEDLFEESIEKLNGIAQKIKIYVITDTQEKARVIKKYAQFLIEVRTYCGKGRDWGALLVSCKDILSIYENVCFIHDKKSEYLAYKSLGKDFGKLLWENMIGSYEHILGILEYFALNENVGMLVPPVANHGIYFENFVNYWTVCYDNSLSLLKDMGLDTSKLVFSKPPISIGSAFWIRTRVLEYIAKNISEDSFSEDYEIDGTINHILERICPYICQKMGLYTVSISDLNYANTLYCNDRYMLRELSAEINGKRNYCTFKKFKEDLEK